MLIILKKLSKEEGELKALNVYQKRKLTKREIGLKYERYLQFYFETKGNWDVYNNGIRKGYKDLGRDLICIKNNTVRIIQAKYWSVSKKIYSNIYGQHNRSWENVLTFLKKGRLPNHGKLFEILREKIKIIN